MTNEELEMKLVDAKKRECKITLEVIELVLEVIKRSLYLKRGYESVYGYLTKRLGYSKPAAGRRVGAALLLNDVPEMRAKILDGSVNLSTASLLQTTINLAEKKTRTKLAQSKKQELVNAIENKTFDKAQRILALIGRS